MPSRKRQAPRKWSVQQRAQAAGAALAALIAVVASGVTIASFMGFGPASTATTQPTPAGAVLSETSNPSPSPFVSIKSAALKTDGGLTIYEVHGSATGVTDPPWRVFIVAKPILDAALSAEESGDIDWFVSSAVLPDKTGDWMAILRADKLPPDSSGVTFQPVLVLSDSSAIPTPSPSRPVAMLPPTPVPCPTPLTALPSTCEGGVLSETASPPGWSLKDELELNGAESDAVQRVFDAFVSRVSPP